MRKRKKREVSGSIKKLKKNFIAKLELNENKYTMPTYNKMVLQVKLNHSSLIKTKTEKIEVEVLSARKIEGVVYYEFEGMRGVYFNSNLFVK